MGNLYIVATPIGNLSDISFRALEILKSVDMILCEDTRQTIKILNRYDFKNKLVAFHKFNENEKSNEIINELKSGKNIALVSDAGTPLISDPGYPLVLKAREEGITVLGVPGASAIITALSISGMETVNFSFLGFLSQDSSKFKEELDLIDKSLINTFVMYESPKRIVKLVKCLKDRFSNSKIFIANDLTKLHERSIYGKVEEVLDIIENDPNIEKGEYVLILQKENIKEEVVEEYTLEAKLINIIFKYNLSMKDAINKLSEDKTIKKNDLYKASLNLKEYFK